MPASVFNLPVRSSPTRYNLLQRAVQLAHVHTLRPTSISNLDEMLSRAVKDNEASVQSQRTALQKQLFPSSSPSAPNGDIREQLRKNGVGASRGISTSARTAQTSTNPLKDRSANVNQAWGNYRSTTGPGRGSLASLYGNANSFKQESGFIDLTGPEAQAKAREAVFFAEDDFSDDENLDLDYEAPLALPVLPSNVASKPVSKESMPPPPTSTQTDTGIPWSSSPLSHFQAPKPQRPTFRTSSNTDQSLKRESPGDVEAVEFPNKIKAKRRKLPDSFQQQQPGHDQEDYHDVKNTPAPKRSQFWDATASAVKEQKKQFKNHRQQQELSREEFWNETEDTDKSNSKVAISLSAEQRQVLDMVVKQNQSVFFTGPAGTGKSVLMRAIITDLKKKHARDPERVAVTASTGLAACNIGGITLHSFSGIGLGKEDASTLIKKIRRNPKAKNRWLKTKVLIIDEVSMVDGELFDKLSQIGRTLRNNGRPWGGIQLVITGDFFQLPPVPDAGAKRETKFAFDASTWSTSIDHTIGLTQVFRQRDPQFARMLNEIRLGKITEETVRAFKALSRPLKFDDGLGKAELFSTRNEVESSNERRLRELPGKGVRYDATDSGDKAVRDKLLMNMMAPKTIELKVDAQVMLIKNMDDSLVNGSLGKVIAFSDEKTFDMDNGGYDSGGEDASMAKARRKLQGFSREPSTSSSTAKYPVVQFMATDGTPRVILCQPEEWKVELPNGEVQAKRSQLPLILAWALSIHKAQGQTLERVKVNLGRVFEKGQAYVALSRATCQEGLEVYGFDRQKVMAHPRVIAFYNKLYSVEEANGMRSVQITDLVANRKGVSGPVPPKKPTEVIDLDDDEEAMASYGY